MFALMDCNNFFASCEMVFNPKLAKVPLVILSNNDGCIVARSQAAKKLGIPMGSPAYLYKDRKEIVMLSANFPLYSDMSQRVMQTLSQFCPEIEIYSIDEAFFHPQDNCTEIRKIIKMWTGIPVSIGIGPTKTLAKLASEIAKKTDGLFTLTQDQVPELLANLDLSEIWGIGKALTEKLKREGIYTAKALTERDDTWLKKIIGITGMKTVLELRGIPCFELAEIPEKKKSIVCSRSFGKKIDTLTELQEAISLFASNAAEKLRAQKSLTTFMTIFICHEQYNSCHIRIPNATHFTPELISLAKQATDRLFEKGRIYRKAGVMLSEFTEVEQTDWITKASKIPPKAMKVLDEINARYDKPILRFAAEGIERRWKSKQLNASPKFTTNWNELPRVR